MQEHETVTLSKAFDLLVESKRYLDEGMGCLDAAIDALTALADAIPVLRKNSQLEQSKLPFPRDFDLTDPDARVPLDARPPVPPETPLQRDFMAFVHFARANGRSLIEFYRLATVDARVFISEKTGARVKPPSFATVKSLWRDGRFPYRWKEPNALVPHWHWLPRLGDNHVRAMVANLCEVWPEVETPEEQSCN